MIFSAALHHVVEVVGPGAGGDVLPAVVADHEHDGALVDLVSDLRRAGQRRAGRDAGEDPDLAQLAGPLDGLAGSDDALAVEQLVATPLLEHRRDVALVDVAQALDPLSQRRLDGDDLDVGVLLLEEPADAHERAAGPEAGHEVGDLGHVGPDLGTGGAVVGGGVRLVGVLVEERPLGVLVGQLAGPGHRAVRTLGTRAEDDLGPVDLEQLAPLDRDVLGQDDLDRVALHPGDHRQGDTGVAR